MPEPAALGPRRLWRAVIRPLVEEASGDVVCDVSDGAIAEGLLVTTRATLHVVGGGDALQELSRVYGDRVVFHPGARSAWAAADRYRLAVLDVGRASPDHVDALTALAESDSAPPVLLEGLGAGRQAPDPVLADFTGRGWAVIELPGFDQIRLVLPGGQRVLEGPTVDAILERLRSGAPALGEGHAAAEAAARADELATRLGEAEQRAAVAAAGRELAERRRAASEDIVAALRLFNDGARADLERARHETEEIRRLAESARADAAVARARTARLSRAQVAVRNDLVRLEASQAWRLGHWLTRAARILTFRKPGRTNAVSRALERLDAVTPSGGDNP